MNPMVHCCKLFYNYQQGINTQRQQYWLMNCRQGSTSTAPAHATEALTTFPNFMGALMVLVELLEKGSERSMVMDSS